MVLSPVDSRLWASFGKTLSIIYPRLWIKAGCLSAGPASQYIAQKGREGGARQAEGRSPSVDSDSDADSSSGGSDDEGTSSYRKGA